MYIRRGPCLAVFCEPIHEKNRKVKKASGDCLRPEGGQQGEGWLLAVENQNRQALGVEQEQASAAPRKNEVQQKAQVLQKTTAECKGFF